MEKIRNIIHKLSTLLRNEFSVLSFLIFCIGISVLETLSYNKESYFSEIAGYIWLSWFGYFLIASLTVSISSLSRDLKTKNLWGLFTLLIIVLFTSFQLNKFPLEINHESASEVYEGLTNFQKNDLSYTKSGFLGYPARQYIITSLPSLGNRSVIAYRLGFLLPFYIGVLLFYSGLVSWCEKNNIKRKYASLPLIAIFNFPFIVVYLRLFEQTILPLSFTLSALGWLLLVLTNFSFYSLIAFIWIFAMLTTSYTPAITSWIIITIFLSWYIFKNIIHRKVRIPLLTGSAILVSAFFLYNTLSLSVHTNLTDKKWHSDRISLSQRLTETFEYFATGKRANIYGHEISFIDPALITAVNLYLITSIIGFLGLEHAVLGILIIAGVLVSGIMYGYADPPPQLAIQRAMTIVPFVLLGIFDAIKKLKITGDKLLFIALYILLFLFGLYNITTAYQRWQLVTDPRTLVLRETLETIKKYNISTKDRIYLGVFSDENTIEFFEDQLKYFFPSYQLLSINNCKNIPNFKPAIYYFTENNQCYLNFISKTKHSYTEHPIEFYQKDLFKLLPTISNIKSIKKIVVK